jgi:hypothetical protein
MGAYGIGTHPASRGKEGGVYSRDRIKTGLAPSHILLIEGGGWWYYRQFRIIPKQAASTAK